MKVVKNELGEVYPSPFKYAVYVSENLDYKKEFPVNPFRYLYVLHKIYIERIKHRKTIKDGFVNLNMQTLQKILHWRDTKMIITELIDRGFIECDNHFIIGNKSKGYRITEKYRVKTHRVESNDSILNRRIRKYNESLNKLYPARYQKLKDMLEVIEIEYENACKFVEVYCTIARYKEIRDSKRISYKNYLKEFTFEDWKHMYQHSVDSIHNKDDLFFIRDETGYRLHTNITNLPKELRKFLRYKGEKLVNLDISNSQPFMLSLILVQSYKNFSSNNFKNTSFSLNQLLNNFSKDNTSYSTPLTFNVNRSYSVDAMPVDVMNYINLTSSGQMYEYLMPMFMDGDRQALKLKLFWKVFYRDSNNKKRIYREEKIFGKSFPNVMEFIKEYKAKNYKDLPIAMQRIESEIILERIAMRIINDNPSCYFLTIHDSILTNESSLLYVENVMKEEFKNFCGIVPNIKIE